MSVPLSVKMKIYKEIDR